MIQQLNRPAQLELASEVRALLYDLSIAAKVLSWDRSLYGTGLGFSASEIDAIAITEDIVWYRFRDGGALPLSIDQFVTYWNQIKQLEADMEAETAEQEATELPPTVDRTPDGLPIDIIELEINGVTETRLGWIETDWDGCLIPHVFLQDGDNPVVWNNHYLKQFAITSPQSTPDDGMEYIRQLEASLCYADLAGW